MSNELKIILIRHSITTGNQKKWYYGITDLKLIDEGIEAIEVNGKEGIYPNINIDKYIHTGMRRTKDTLQLIYGKDALHSAFSNEKLREFNFGIYECKTFEELQSDEAFMKWAFDTSGDVRLEGGESSNEFAQRVTTAFFEEVDNAKQEKLSNIVFVIHGGSIAHIMKKLFPSEEKSFWDWIPKPARGYVLSLYNEKWSYHTL